MDKFIQRENIRHLRRMLDLTENEADRRRILQLLLEEEARDVRAAPPEIRSKGGRGGRDFA
jgi:hypothetical protein